MQYVKNNFLRKDMGSIMSSPKDVIFPLKQEATVVDMAEVEALSLKIENVIKKCTLERESIKTNYGCNPDTVEIASCTATFVYEGDRHGTFLLLQSRFKNKTKVFELQTKLVRDDSDDYVMGADSRAPNYYWEHSAVKVVV
jgi:hypothetical protein